MQMTIDERLREIRSIASCEDAHVAISDLADCMLKINERLERIEKQHTEESESTDWQEEAQNEIDELDHGAY